MSLETVPDLTVAFGPSSSHSAHTARSHRATRPLSSPDTSPPPLAAGRFCSIMSLEAVSRTRHSFRLSLTLNATGVNRNRRFFCMRAHLTALPSRHPLTAGFTALPGATCQRWRGARDFTFQSHSTDSHPPWYQLRQYHDTAAFWHGRNRLCVTQG